MGSAGTVRQRASGPAGVLDVMGGREPCVSRAPGLGLQKSIDAPIFSTRAANTEVGDSHVVVAGL